ncbi:hypothetical protein CR513_19246, partial [Mucuna pruriens]
MDVTFHEIQSFFINHPLYGESYLEVEPVIELLPFPTQDIIDLRSHETRFGLRENPIVWLEASIPENPIEDVTDDMPIALRKGKRSYVKFKVKRVVGCKWIYTVKSNHREVHILEIGGEIDLLIPH